jgi:hypothetical protein
VLSSKQLGHIQKPEAELKSSAISHVGGNDSTTYLMTTKPQPCERTIEQQWLEEHEKKLKELQNQKSNTEKELSDVKKECEFFRKKCKSWDEIQSLLAEKSPAIPAMVDVLIEREREDNEFKSQKILTILKAKDVDISEVASALMQCQNTGKLQMSEIESLRHKLEDSSCEISKLKDTLSSVEDIIQEKESEIATQKELIEDITQVFWISSFGIRFFIYLYRRIVKRNLN